MFQRCVYFSLPTLHTRLITVRTTGSYNGRKLSAICSFRNSYDSKAEVCPLTAIANSATKRACTAASIALRSNSFAQGA